MYKYCFSLVASRKLYAEKLCSSPPLIAYDFNCIARRCNVLACASCTIKGGGKVALGLA